MLLSSSSLLLLLLLLLLSSLLLLLLSTLNVVVVDVVVVVVVVVVIVIVVVNSNKIQNGNILVPASRGCPGKCLLKDCHVVAVVSIWLSEEAADSILPVAPRLAHMNYRREGGDARIVGAEPMRANCQKII